MNNGFLGLIGRNKELFSSDIKTYEEDIQKIVSNSSKTLPDFAHKETGKYLDVKI
tara:strand:+ start:708 stop:872 length:165 start_codon:yes stop_codon:yes gene_type:complete